MKITHYFIMEEEIWKDIDGYDGNYKISNLGRIKSYKSSKGAIIMKQRLHNGYYYIQFKKDGVIKDFSVHRLVALAFIPKVKNKPIIDHIDGNPKNNNISNLRWCTYKENSNFPIAHKRKKEAMMIVGKKRRGISLSEETRKRISKSRIGKYKGEENPFYGKKHTEETKIKISNARHYKGIPVVQLSKNGDKIRVWSCASEAGDKLKINKSSITECCRGKRKTIGGYKWKYYKEF